MEATERAPGALTSVESAPIPSPRANRTKTTEQNDQTNQNPGNVPSKDVQTLTPETQPRTRSNSTQSSSITTIGSAANGLVNAFATFTSSFGSKSTNSNSSTSASAGNSFDTQSISSTGQKINSTSSSANLELKKLKTERCNLIRLTHLIVRDLIASSIKTNRTIDGEKAEEKNVHLHNFFTLVEKVLKHGLKGRILSVSKASGLWNVLDSLPRYMRHETTMISESIRSLPNAKSTDGRIRAWMRLAMMQKKLPEYFQHLLELRDELLKEIYHENAFMMSDEGTIFSGLIIGVNVIDCNFFVKDENFDDMDPIIDLTPYLKPPNPGFETIADYDIDANVQQLNNNYDDGEKGPNIDRVLDQKNYLEELNGHLKNLVQDLQSKLKLSEEKNRSVEMELRLSETRVKTLQKSKSSSQNLSVEKDDTFEVIENIEQDNDDGNLHVKESSDVKECNETNEKVSLQESIENSCDLEKSANQKNIESVVDEKKESGVEKKVKSDQADQSQTSELEKSFTTLKEEEIARLKERMAILEESLRDSLKKIKTLTSQLDIKSSMNNEKDTTISLLKNEIREKQDQIDSVRSQLNDIKQLNRGLFERLEKSDTNLKERIQTVTKLQTNLDKWKIEHRELSNKYFELEREKNAITKEIETLRQSNAELSQSNGSIVENLRREREETKTTKELLEKQTLQLANLHTKCHRLQEDLFELKEFKRKHDELLMKNKEYELSLEQIGAQLRDSQLEVESLKESANFLLQAQWMDAKNVKECTQCHQAFSLTIRKHHCRNCGRVLCTKCSDQVIDMPSSSKPVRVCDHCYAILILKKCQVPSNSNSSTAT